MATDVNNKLSYQTNFTGIKYNNNPLNADPKSFSSANNVYLNKYGALISRPPVKAIEYPWEVYGTNPIPINLKIVDSYNLFNKGIIFVLFDTNTELYILRYKSPLGTYATIITSVTIDSYDKFAIAKYKQYYICFTSDGARVLDTTLDTNTWVALSTTVDIPVTVVQTGSSRVTLEGNNLTQSHKEQYIIKTDSDDTIYFLPNSGSAEVSFLEQTDVTYTLTEANQYTRDRLLRKLNIPTYVNESISISMVGEKIAIAHSDRVDISLDYGETFETIVYPTISSNDYKNTASLSDDGLHFFYVHTNGVYRYDIGTGIWALIEVVATPEYNFSDSFGFDSYSLEKDILGSKVTSDMLGANYCHFVNAEKFVFMLAYKISISGVDTWVPVFYSKGLNITNLYTNVDDTAVPVAQTDYLISAYKVNGAAINTICTDASGDIQYWLSNPYLNKRAVKVVNNDLVVFYYKVSNTATKITALNTSKTYVYFVVGEFTVAQSIDYMTYKNSSLVFATNYEINDVLVISEDTVNILVRKEDSITYWFTHTYDCVTTSYPTGGTPSYTITFTIVTGEDTVLTDITAGLPIIHRLGVNKYLASNTLIVTEDNAMLVEYDLLDTINLYDQVVSSGNNYIGYSEADGWYTNIPLQAVLTYEFIDDTEFTKVPTAQFDDQNLWLGVDKELWIVNLIDNKLSSLPSNSNAFSKPVTNICPISTTSKAIFFDNGITLCEEDSLTDGSIVWYYYPLKFSVGVNSGDTVLITNDGKLTIFPTKYGLAALTYQLNVASTEQAITYLTDDDIKSLWIDFYNVSSKIRILHVNTQLIITNGTNQILIYDFRTSGWYPLTLPTDIKISKVQADADNYELLELQPLDAPITILTAIYSFSKEKDELYSYTSPYKDLGTLLIPWHITSQVLILDAPNHYKNISQLIVDQVDSSELKQSAYLTTQLFRQFRNVLIPSIELEYDIDTFAKITKKVNWWKVLGIKWQLENNSKSSYPTQLRLYNISVKYDISYEVK